MKIRIVLADGHRIMREGLKALIDKEEDMEVVEEAKNGAAAVRLARRLLPRIIIMGIGMPEMNGIEATRRILSENKEVKVIALSNRSDRRFVVEMLKAGASGYLLKDSAFEELVNAVHAVMAGQLYLNPRIADMVVRECLLNLPKEELNVFTILTAREREVLQLMAEGKSTKQIALTLSLSVKTVETHRQQIMEKLEIRTVAELTKYAIREGITSL